jgi:hypothetical protein
MRKLFGGLAILCAVVVAAPARGDDYPNFNKRGTSEKDERAFVDAVTINIVKAARTCKDITLKEYKFKEVKAGQTDLIIVAGYKGKVTSKPYTADITVHLNSATKGKWSVLSIDYKDNNNLKWTGKKNVDALVSKFNDASK